MKWLKEHFQQFWDVPLKRIYHHQQAQVILIFHLITVFLSSELMVEYIFLSLCTVLFLCCCQ